MDGHCIPGQLTHTALATSIYVLYGWLDWATHSNVPWCLLLEPYLPRAHSIVQCTGISIVPATWLHGLYLYLYINDFLMYRITGTVRNSATHKLLFVWKPVISQNVYILMFFLKAIWQIHILYTSYMHCKYSVDRPRNPDWNLHIFYVKYDIIYFVFYSTGCCSTPCYWAWTAIRWTVVFVL